MKRVEMLQQRNPHGSEQKRRGQGQKTSSSSSQAICVSGTSRSKDRISSGRRQGNTTRSNKHEGEEQGPNDSDRWFKAQTDKISVMNDKERQYEDMM